MTGGSFGRSVKRVEDARLVRGKGRYVDDMALSGQLWAAFVRSPYAHARISGVDGTAALAMPGVVQVVTGADLEALGVPMMPCGWMLTNRDGSAMQVADRRVLPTDIVRFAGEPVALVVAESREQARDAAEAVAVDYAELPTVVDIAAALADGAPQLHEPIANNRAFDWQIGDEAATDAALAGAAHRIALTLRNNRLEIGRAHV